jgi:hypothetical protein
MNYNKVKKRIRRKRRKSIIAWYKFLKRKIKRNESVFLGCCVLGLNSYGQQQAARLLCAKNKQLKIIYKEPLIHKSIMGAKLVWKK